MNITMKAADPARKTNWRWVICSLLFFATTINYLDRQVLSLTWKDFIAPEFHWSDSDYGVITGLFSLFYAICEQFPPVWPDIASHPLIAAVVGAIFVGVGVGVCVRAGGAPGGDDALAMSLTRLTHIDIQWIYLFTDVVVLGLSVTYIPLTRIGYSLLTVILSGQIIGLMQKLGAKKA